MTIKILLGTTKGVFILTSDAARASWTVSGPLCDGWPINHVLGEKGSERLWAAGGGAFNGAGIWRSTDAGESWTLAKLANGQMDEWIADNPEEAASFGLEPSPPAPFTGKIENVWSLGLSGGKVYAGVKPAALYQSPDGGAAWSEVEGLGGHASREEWQPGAAGLILHSIVSDPGDPTKLWTGISAAGVFASEDGGASWERRNRRSNAPGEVVDHSHPAGSACDGTEIGHCVHNFVRAPGPGGEGGDLLYQQNHHGVFRSVDGGRSWNEISAGLPSKFGFPIAVHPREPLKIWVFPLNGDMAGRFPPEASAAVWHSADGGETWQAERAGLPAQDCFFTVLRQAMATDRCDEAGIYFGTNTGSVFWSRAGSGQWTEIARHLPTVLSVETWQPA